MDDNEARNELIAYIKGGGGVCTYGDVVVFSNLLGESGRNLLDKMINEGILLSIGDFISISPEYSSTRKNGEPTSAQSNNDSKSLDDGADNTDCREAGFDKLDEFSMQHKPMLFDTTSVDSLTLSARSMNALVRKHVKNIRELVAALSSVGCLTGIGQKSAEEIKSSVATRALPPIETISEHQSQMLESISQSNEYIFDEFGMLHATKKSNAAKMGLVMAPGSDILVRDLQIRPATAQAFSRCGIVWVSQALTYSDDELLALPNIGATKLNALRAACEEVCIAPDQKDQAESIEEGGTHLPEWPFAGIDSHLAKMIDEALMEIKAIGIDIREDEWKVFHIAKAIEILNDPYEEKAFRLAQQTFDGERGPGFAETYLNNLLGSALSAGSFGCINIPNSSIWDQAAENICDGKAYVRLNRDTRTLIPLYPSLEQWIETLEPRQQEILSARLSGKTLEECGYMFGVTRERIRQICAKIIKKKPVIQEDKWREFYETYQTGKETFCQVTGEPPSTYYLFHVSGVKKGSKPLSEAPDDPNAPEGVKAAIERMERKKYIPIGGEKVRHDKRSIIQALVRAYASDQAIGLEELYDLYVKTLEEEGLAEDPVLDPTNRRAFGAILDRIDSIINAPHPASVNDGRGIRYYESEDMDFQRLANAIAQGPLRNIECSTALIVRDARYSNILEEFDIRDEYELHNVLKRFCQSAKGFTLGRTPNITIGRATRKQQVLGLIQDMEGADKDELAAEYELRYGVVATTFLANYLKDFGAYERNGKYTCSSAKLTQAQREFVKSQFKGDYMSLALIRSRFGNRFPGSDSHAVNATNLCSSGLTVHEALLVKKSANLRLVFRQLIGSRSRFSLHDEGFGPDVVSDSVFQSELRQAVGRFDVVEYEKDRFVSFDALRASCSWLERSMLQGYADAACKFFPRETPFNVMRLSKHGFTNELDRLREELGLGNYLFDSLIATNYMGGKVKKTSVVEMPVFCVTYSSFAATDLIESIVSGSEGIEIDDIIDFLKDEYGIATTPYFLRGILARSDIYYHEGLEMAFESIEAYERKAREWI